jgi:hypothetical protein
MGKDPEMIHNNPTLASLPHKLTTFTHCGTSVTYFHFKIIFR